MADSYLRLYTHFVWTTQRRSPILVPEVEAVAYRCILQTCEEFKVKPLALGGIEDHIHLVVNMSATCTIAHFVKCMKGSSSHLVSNAIPEAREFAWQEGYGAISVDSTNLDRVIRYVQNQKERHARGKLWPSLEKSEDRL